MQKQADELDSKRDLSRFWAHFDFDMFFIAVEMLDKPELRDKPAAVGTDNSVISTANY